ncbi:spore germination protein [Aquibacillus koreensis]|uniref:Spore germination protein n=1 Tax=Aquibacillus koreensis TaxID=279446 RepID=A0A9X4AJ38_9BACI|nr:spore germination protein [Aquibacillus koreensis]MCT2537269.1 spore germination protein [Aquibacillus koreensis]MDC3421616.1 spore germination protein [Aquibacillus koreensis]
MSFFRFLLKDKQENSQRESTIHKQKQKPTLEAIKQEFSNCDDLVEQSFDQIGITILFFGHLIEPNMFNRDIVEPLTSIRSEEFHSLMERKQYQKVKTSDDTVQAILKGYVAIFDKKETYIVNAFGPKERSISQSETESIITGAHDSFVESMNTNISLIRRRLNTPKLKVKKFAIGDLSNTSVFLLYIEDIVNPDLLKELENRISNVKTDIVADSSMFVQLIDNSPHSVFPQFFTTERPDVVVNKLASGKIAGLTDHSPNAFTTPTNFFEFFESPDDNNQRWIVGTLVKWMRYVAFIVTLCFTALYVSATTYSYEIIPQTILMSLAESRDRVPFPPLVEALILEIALELLREAGVRLPTKIGQTIGIVGGIVIGQAAVDAGLVSNTLIIVVAISAISSFVIPNYILSATLRIARFMLIILAGAFGNFGLVVGLVLLIIHLGSLTNLGTPYVNPVAPMHPKDLLLYFIRPPHGMKKYRPTQSISPEPDKRQK